MAKMLFSRGKKDPIPLDGSMCRFDVQVCISGAQWASAQLQVEGGHLEAALREEDQFQQVPRGGLR